MYAAADAVANADVADVAVAVAVAVAMAVATATADSFHDCCWCCNCRLRLRRCGPAMACASTFAVVLQDLPEGCVPSEAIGRHATSERDPCLRPVRDRLLGLGGRSAVAPR